MCFLYETYLFVKYKNGASDHDHYFQDEDKVTVMHQSPFPPWNLSMGKPVLVLPHPKRWGWDEVDQAPF